MATELTVSATEGSTYVITASFTDEDGSAVVPDTVTWTLTDTLGTVINSRQDVSETPASSIEIVLTGDDLAVDGYNSPVRVFTVEGTYTSLTHGAGLLLTGSATFTVERLAGVA